MVTVQTARIQIPFTAHSIQRIADEKKRNIPRENYLHSWL